MNVRSSWRAGHAAIAREARLDRSGRPELQSATDQISADVGIDSACCRERILGETTAFSLAPGMRAPRHTHTREDEACCVLAGEPGVTILSSRAEVKSRRDRRIAIQLPCSTACAMAYLGGNDHQQSSGRSHRRLRELLPHAFNDRSERYVGGYDAR
jgi:hypothetical protein